MILNVGGKAVSNVGDVRSALGSATSNGKHSVLMQVKTADATRFIAVPLKRAEVPSDDGIGGQIRPGRKGRPILLTRPAEFTRTETLNFTSA